MLLSMPAQQTPKAHWTVIAWNDLGMHCMDKDYSVFGILPPFNNLHVQLIDNTGKLCSTSAEYADGAISVLVAVFKRMHSQQGPWPAASTQTNNAPSFNIRHELNEALWPRSVLPAWSVY
jgi:hypothetical protein